MGENKDRWGLNQSVGGSAVIYSDIFLNSFFAISPEFSMHFMRGLIGAVESDFVGEQIPTDFVAWSSNEFTTGVMIKLYYKWFYGGFGMGASYTTAPRFRSAIQWSGSGSDTADSVAMLNSQARKGSWGYNNSFELGFDIPVGPGRFNISSRSTLDYVNFFRFIDYPSNNNTALRTGSIARSTFFLGYSYSFI